MNIGRAAGENHEAAVIDVGSNSVRLVVYRLDGRAMTPVLNEKVMAGLGRDMKHTGALSEQGVEIALRAIRRFATLLEELGVSDVRAVATAAVREARDGAAFARRIQSETGVRLRILAGAEEARLSALGALAGAPEAHGIVGDLGGSSLELVEINPTGPGPGETFALGHLALMDDAPFDYERVAAVADAALADAATLKAKGGDFYAVGGAWRALGRIDITLNDHPLGVLHQHQMSRAEVLKVAEFVRRQSKRSLEKLEEAAAKRADSLPYAAVVLERVMQAGGFDRVILSAFGLREGVLIERMNADMLKADPLIASAEALAGHSPRTRAFGAALAAWIAPMFDGQVLVFPGHREHLLRGAAARLADIGGLLHPDQRAEIMFDLVLRSPLTALSHAERAFLAAAIHHRYAKPPPKAAPAYERLLSDEMRKAAAALGAALRLGADVSGRSDGVLAAFQAKAEGGVLTLTVSRRFAHLMTEQASKRLDAAASALGLTAKSGVA